MTKHPTSQDQANDLELMIDNYEPIYRQKIVIFKTLTRKKINGTFNSKKAETAFFNFATLAARWHNKQRHTSIKVLVPARHLAAKDLLQEFLSAYKNNEYDFMITAKTKHSKTRRRR